MKQLFLSDLDGTLLNPDSRISDTSAEIISSLSREGALISVATARTPATVDPLLARTYTTIPAITMTGAALWLREKQQIVNPQFMDRVHAAAVIEACRRQDLNPIDYTLGADGIIHAYVSGKLSKRESSFIDQRRHLKLKRFHINEQNGANEASHPDTMLIFSIGPAEKVEKAAAEIALRTPCAISFYPDTANSQVALLEVFAPGVSKAAAALRLKAELGAGELTVFGDNLNDLPLMAVADISVAVGNALPQVREAADIVIDTNATDAVARYIRENYNGR